MIPEMNKLNQASGPDQIKATMASCIATEVKNGRPQDQAVAICGEMMKKKMAPAQSPPPQNMMGQV